MIITRVAIATLGACVAVAALAAQRPELSTAVRAYVKVDAPVVALTHVRVIDGTGAAAKEDQTLVIRDVRIEHVFYPVFPSDRDAEQVLDWLRG